MSGSVRHIPENLLHFVWKTKLINLNNLKTSKGESITLKDFGFHNSDAGPDFSNGRVEIDGTLWAGHIEMHVLSSDWDRHQHSSDLAYDNVILHVVYQHDRDIKRKDGTIIPTLELQPILDQELLNSYAQLMDQETWIPCEKLLSTVDLSQMPVWLEGLSIERIESKTKAYLKLLNTLEQDWDATFHVATLQRLGMKVNKDAMLRLGMHLPLHILLKHQDSLFQLEALAFGVAGYLNEEVDHNEYQSKLRQEYQFLSKKYDLSALDSKILKQGRLRPQNLPTLRIAQYVRLIHQEGRLFSKVLDCQTIDEIKDLFALTIDEGYWYDHHTFGKTTRPQIKSIGETAILSIIINLVVPMLYLKGRLTDDQTLQNLSLNILEKLKPEKNSIIDKWTQNGITSTDARESQALLQLKTEYCDHKRCLDCPIGYKLLTQK